MKEKDRILLSHGDGGKGFHQLMEEIFFPFFKNDILSQRDDCGVFSKKGQRFSFSTDTFVVDPVFFPGGDIGKLAVCGTVNDVAMAGARPLYLSAGFILEEGFLVSDLKRILGSMEEAAKEAGVVIVTGDTKVVPRGSADKIFINTSGIGIIDDGVNVSGNNARPGDCIIVSGTIGDHGIAVLSEREGLKFKGEVLSDVAPLNGLVDEILKEGGKSVHVMRDPTRGGVATSLNEIALQSNVGISIDEEGIPVSEAVRGASEMLGIDPLYLPCEGKVLVFVKEKKAEGVLEAMRKHQYGKNAWIIGTVLDSEKGSVLMKTGIGGTRIVDMLHEAQLPRIC
jgi:hydrogenase expression/formation protein HypE